MQRKENSSADSPLINRRSFCFGIGGCVALAAMGSLRFVPSAALVRPPGGQDEKRLLASCVHCERCVEACPRGVITLSHIEDGIVGMRTPTMRFYSDYCDFCAEENGGVALCAAYCPTGALEVPADVPAESIVIGKAVLYKDQCLAYHDTGCHTCYDVCPYEAIGLDGENRPYVIEDACNGCGACEAACVSFVNGSRSMSSGSAIGRAIKVETER